MSQAQNNDNTANKEVFSIVIVNLNHKRLLVQNGNKSLLHYFHSHGVDWMYACGGKGRCTTCKVIVMEGLENLGAMTPAEQQYKKNGFLKKNERLACQASVFGPIKVAVPNEGKLPHLKYSL